MLALRPHRLGHMCFLDDGLEATLRQSRIPLELCISSNVITESVKGYPDHHFLPLFHSGMPLSFERHDAAYFPLPRERCKLVYGTTWAFGFAGHPVILCTDDSGVFSTSLSREYAIAAQAFNLDEAALFKLAEGGLQHCFCSENVKVQLSERFKQFHNYLMRARTARLTASTKQSLHSPFR